MPRASGMKSASRSFGGRAGDGFPPLIAATRLRCFYDVE